MPAILELYPCSKTAFEQYLPAENRWARITDLVDEIDWLEPLLL
jgi:hypothetical protein